MLYGIERQHGGDNVRQLDMENSGATKRLLELHQSVKWIDMVADDRWVAG